MEIIYLLFIYWWRRRTSFVTVCFEWSLLLFTPLIPNTFSAFLTIAHWNASICLLSPSACLYCYILFLHHPVPNYINNNFCLLYIPLSFFFCPFAISEQTFSLCLNVHLCSKPRDVSVSGHHCQTRFFAWNVSCWIQVRTKL